MTHADKRDTPDETTGAGTVETGIYDDVARLAAVTDEGPDVLDIEDRPDPNPDRDAGPKPEDGPQDVNPVDGGGDAADPDGGAR